MVKCIWFSTHLGWWCVWVREHLPVMVKCVWAREHSPVMVKCVWVREHLPVMVKHVWVRNTYLSW